MDQLGQAGCVDIIIDRINKDLSERQFGIGGHTKCEPFPSGETPIGELNGDNSLCGTVRCLTATFALQNELHLKSEPPKRINCPPNNPSISDLVQGKLMNSLDSLVARPRSTQVRDLTVARHPTNQPVNSDESKRSVINLNDSDGHPQKSESRDDESTSSQLPSVQQLAADLIGSIDDTQVSADLKALPMPDPPLFTCLSSDPAYSDQKAGQPCGLVHATEPDAAGHNEELVTNKKVSNAANDCSS